MAQSDKKIDNTKTSDSTSSSNGENSQSGNLKKKTRNPTKTLLSQHLTKEGYKKPNYSGEDLHSILKYTKRRLERTDNRPGNTAVIS